MSSPSTATQPAPLSQQIASLQAFATAGAISHKPGEEPTSPADARINTQSLREKWERLQKLVLGNDSPDFVHSSWDPDAPEVFTSSTFTSAQEKIGSRLGSLAQGEVSRAVLDQEGVDPFTLEQHAESGLLLVEPVRTFNFAAAQYLQTGLDKAKIKLGDFILLAAQTYYSGAAGPLQRMGELAKPFFEAVESKVTFNVRGPLRPDRLPDIFISNNQANQHQFFARNLFPQCNSALRVLVAGNTRLRPDVFFELPLLVQSDMGLMQSLYRAGLMDARVVGAFLARLGVIPEGDDRMTVL